MGKKKKQKKSPKWRKRKVSLPKDRNGTPINIGDWLMFDEGPIRVYSLTMLSDGDWIAGTEEDDFASDNLSGGVVITGWR